MCPISKSTRLHGVNCVLVTEKNIQTQRSVSHPRAPQLGTEPRAGRRGQSLEGSGPAPGSELRSATCAHGRSAVGPQRQTGPSMGHAQPGDAKPRNGSPVQPSVRCLELGRNISEGKQCQMLGGSWRAASHSCRPPQDGRALLCCREVKEGSRGRVSRARGMLPRPGRCGRGAFLSSGRGAGPSQQLCTDHGAAWALRVLIH